jgi:hypothetical protein
MVNDYLFFQAKHDWVRGQVTAHNFNMDIEFETAACDLNMSEVNYTPAKWKQLIRVYLNVDELGIMIARLLHYQGKGGKHKHYIPDIGMNFKARTNASGACLMAFTVGYNLKDGWHAEIFTRASELTMRWFMDLIFIHVLIREIGEKLGFTPEDCKVYWHMVSTYQSITSMPLFLVMAGKEQWIIDNMPEGMDMQTPKPNNDLTEWQWGTIRRYVKSFLGGHYMNFRVQKRPAEMYRILKGEMEPKNSILTEDLTLPKLDSEINLNFEEDDE